MTEIGNIIEHWNKRQVTATNTVTVRFQNETGGTINLGSGTIRVRVRKVPNA